MRYLLKRALPALLLTLTGLSARAAYDYNYMVIEETDGTETFIPSEGLSFKVAGDRLEAISSEGEKLFSFSSLKSMHFISEETGIDNIFSDNDAVDLFAPDGKFIGHFASFINAREAISISGIYIFKGYAKTAKILIVK